MLSLTLGRLLSGEGHARQANAGMMFGGILNVVLDPILIFSFDMDVTGTALAAAFSNAMSVVLFAVQYLCLGKRGTAPLSPKYFFFRFVQSVFFIGIASAPVTALGNASNMVMVRLASCGN